MIFASRYGTGRNVELPPYIFHTFLTINQFRYRSHHFLNQELTAASVAPHGLKQAGRAATSHAYSQELAFREESISQYIKMQ